MENSVDDFEINVRAYENTNYVTGITHNGVDVLFAQVNWLTLYRARTLFTKEPETVQWIETMSSDDVLIDVGANIGMYTIWAAKTRGMKVFSFEPEAHSYAILNRNIFINGLQDQVRAFCAAVSDKPGLDVLYLSNQGYGAGFSSHQLHDKVDADLKPADLTIAQGIIAVTLDGAVAAGSIPQPTHLKVDVDGIEHKVVEGCRGILADRRLRSALIEINTDLPLHLDIVDTMKGFGFTYDRQQVAASYPGSPHKNFIFNR